VPTFDLEIAAGGWVEVAESGIALDEQQIDHGLFRVRVRGDSMLPAFEQGCYVQFRCVRWGVDEIEVGKPHYVQRNDGYATLKVIELIDDEGLTLRATNQAKYPEPMRVKLDDIVRLAVAAWIMKRV
jgi:SOS-response transcriptional repressor LexA